MSKNEKEVRCIFCRRSVVIDARNASALCAVCVAKLADAPPPPKTIVVLAPEEKEAKKEEKRAKKVAKLEAKKTATRGKGRGWHLKQLFEWEGEFFSFGKPVNGTDVAKIRKTMKKAGI